MISSLYVKLIGGVVAALILVGLVLGLKHYKALAASRGDKLATICSTTREASGHPKLDCGDVPAQITFLGQAVSALSNSLKVQNAAVASMGAQSTAQQQAASQASKTAQERAGKAQATSTRLETSSRSGEAQAKPCAPSAALKGAWQ